jgi:hypothetical protein
MLPAFLLPEKIASEDGHGAHVALDEHCGQRVHLTLGITHILERESLEVHVCGSPDGEKWKRIATFPNKSFCEKYSLTLDLAKHREVKYLRAEWKMQRWTHQEARPIFSFYVWAEHRQAKALQAAS